MAHDVTLEDKYDLSHGRVYMTGTQALVRLLLAQKARDAAAGLNTGGFVSGYRGSPLGAVDQEMWKAGKRLQDSGIVFQPGLNEELAATAVWGTQMVKLDPEATVDGVFSLWYGKGPAWTAAATSSSTATWPAVPSTAACCWWLATTTPARAAACRTRANTPSSPR